MITNRLIGEVIGVGGVLVTTLCGFSAIHEYRDSQIILNEDLPQAHTFEEFSKLSQEVDRDQNAYPIDFMLAVGGLAVTLGSVKFIRKSQE